MSNLRTIYHSADESRRIVVDVNTGEVKELMMVEVEAGSTIRSPAQQEAWKKHLEDKQRKDFIYSELRKLGNFYFLSVEHPIDNISPDAATRLIYLGTYLPYGGGPLMLAKKRPLLVSDLPQVMKLSRQTVDRFLREVSEYISINDDGTILLDDRFFIRGRLPKKTTEGFQRIYALNVRQLYNNIPISYHRKLGYIFKMLPYLNTEYNMLCWNPEERDLDSIQPLTLKDFCNLCGYGYNQISRLRKAYAEIQLDVKGIPENFCSFVYNGVDIGSAKIFVNPHIVYRGTNYERVKVLGHFCQVS